MIHEQNYDNLSYAVLLRAAKGTAKILIPMLCAALRRENPNYSNYEIREIVMKDCISIWQKATIREALPDEYKINRSKRQHNWVIRSNTDQHRPQSLIKMITGCETKTSQTPAPLA